MCELARDLTGKNMAKIIFKPILPRGMNIGAYKDAIDRALREEGKVIEGLYTGVSRGFDPPVVRYETKGPRGFFRRSITVSTRDRRMVHIDRGTSVRWAVMSQNFRPKTRVRSLTSRRGAGRTLIRGRRAMTARNISPRPGIKARLFSDTIAKREKSPFAKRVQDEINSAAKRTF